MKNQVIRYRDDTTGIYCQHKPFVCIKDATTGITLVALVVTIVVLLILAGITLVYVFGDNSVFKQASEAKLKTDIAQWQERLEMAKSPVFIEGLGTFDPDRYFTYIQQQGIINNKDTDVIDNEDGTYDVTTKPGYVFLVTLMPNPEKPTDAQIEYIGQEGKLPPRIKSIQVTGKTGTSIDIKVEVTRLDDGKLSYYYKEVDELDSEYKEVKKDVVDLTATIGNLTDGKIYDIKVIAKNKNGEYDLVIKEAIQQLVKEIKLDKTSVTLGKGKNIQLQTTVLPQNAENKTLEWSSSNESIAIVDENGLVTGNSNGSAVITAKTTDGSDISTTCTVTVITLVTEIKLSKTEETIKVGKNKALTATILPADASNKAISWSTNDAKVASVGSNKFIIYGESAGTATITVKARDGSNVTATCSITVKEISSLEKEVGKEQTSNKTVYDDYNNKVVIPGGYKVVQDGTENVTYSYSEDGSPNVQDGVVIQDSKGNQFVWIPVGSIKNKNNTTTTITLGRYTFASNGTPTLQQNATNYSNSVTINSYYQELSSYREGSQGGTLGSGVHATARNLSGFVESVRKNSGFYLAAYEAGTLNGQLVFQYNQTIYTGSQITAADRMRKFNDKTNVESDLVNSYAWDTAINFIEKFSGNPNYANMKMTSTNVYKTGKSNDKVCNINDMVANGFEWTTEHSTENKAFAVCRAGTRGKAVRNKRCLL